MRFRFLMLGVLVCAGMVSASLMPAPPASAQAACPATSLNRYVQGGVEQWDTENPVRPAANNPEKNLALRSYVVTENLHDLVEYGPTDPNSPPQFATVFHPDRMPIFMTLYQVHDWVGNPGQRAAPITTWPVTAMSLESVPGEWVQPPYHSYNIGHPGEVGGYVVLYADDDSVVLTVSRADSGAWGYTVYFDGLCTDPNLLSLYQSLDTAERNTYTGTPRDGKLDYDLPIVRAEDVLGTARGTEIVIAVRDSGSFMDPRSEYDWWEIHPPYAPPTPALFLDLPVAGREWLDAWIKTGVQSGIAFQCLDGQARFCPDAPITRLEVPVFILNALNYPNLPYTPIYEEHSFADMQLGEKGWMLPFAQAAYENGLMKHCGRDPNSDLLLYCPDGTITRAEMAVSVLRAKYGRFHKPPKAGTPIFADVPMPKKYWMQAWIEQAYEEGIIADCGTNASDQLLFCPDQPVTRAQMTVLILNAFEGLPKP